MLLEDLVEDVIESIYLCALDMAVLIAIILSSHSSTSLRRASSSIWSCRMLSCFINSIIPLCKLLMIEPIASMSLSSDVKDLFKFVICLVQIERLTLRSFFAFANSSATSSDDGGFVD